MFAAPVDICNQALQFCGARRVVTLGDDSVNANACNFAYDQVRRNELRRNCWGFSIRRCVLRPVSLESLTFVPSSWAIGTTYALGALVSYVGETGTATEIWQSTVASNLGNAPGPTSTQWSLYFGPVNYEPFDSTYVSYAGEVCYIPAAYASGTTYAAGAVVTYSGLPYLSLVGSNTGNTPSSSPTDWVVQAWPLTKTGVVWNVNSQYALGTFVTYGGGLYYALSTNNGNLPTNATYWALVVQQGPVCYLSLFPNNASVPGVDANWLALAGTSTSLQILYPYNAGPVNDAASPNAFMLPYGYLKEAPQDPKAGSQTYLGAPSGGWYSDWVIENGLILSRFPEPIQFRFSADVVNVGQFDSMFCIGFAAAIAATICEEVTQSVSKLSTIRQEYQKAMIEARLTNGIEQGPTEPPEDSFLTCRV